MPPRKKPRKKPEVSPQPMLYEVDRGWFQSRIKEVELSQRAVARDIGLDPSSFNRTLKGARKMQVHELAKLIQLLRVTPYEALAHLGFPVETVRVPILGTINAEGEIGPASAPRKGETLDVPPGAPPGLQAYVFETHASPLALWDQCVAFVLPQKGVDADAVGRLALIECRGRKKAILGSVVKGTARGRLRVVPFAQAATGWESDECSASPVLWIKTA